MARTVRLTATALAVMLAGTLTGLPSGASAAPADRGATTITRQCSGHAEVQLRIAAGDGARHFRARGIQAPAGSRWEVRWSYSTGQSGTGEDDTATASGAGVWVDRFAVGEVVRHFEVTMRAASRAGQICRVHYEQ
jgi:hypothetical protein